MVNLSFSRPKMAYLAKKYNLEFLDEELVLSKNIGTGLLSNIEIILIFAVPLAISYALFIFTDIPLELAIFIFVLLTLFYVSAMVDSSIKKIKGSKPNIIVDFFNNLNKKYYISPNSLLVSVPFSLFKKTKMSPLESIYIDENKSYSKKGVESHSTIRIRAVLKNGKHMDLIERVRADDARKLKKIFEEYALLDFLPEKTMSIAEAGRELFGDKFLVKIELGSVILSLKKATRVSFGVIVGLSLVLSVFVFLFLILTVNSSISWAAILSAPYIIILLILFYLLFYFLLRRQTGTDYIISDSCLSVIERPLKIKSFEILLVDILKIFYLEQFSKEDDGYILYVRLKDGNTKKFGAAFKKIEHVAFLQKALQECIDAELAI